MDKPYFSVVIPLYNKREFVAYTVESVLNQKHERFELIIVDDGSSDGSGEVIKRFSDSRIHYIRQQNQGVSAARNRGIDAASGEFVAFLDSDDLWDEYHLSEIANLINLFPHASGFATSYRFKYADDIYEAPRFSVAIRSHWKGIVTDYFAACMRDPLVTASSFVVKKEVFKYVGKFPVGYGASEDLELWARVAAFGEIAFSNIHSVIYRKDNDNNSRRNYLLERDFVLLGTLKRLRPWNGQARSIKRYLALYTLKCAMRYAVLGDKRNGKRLCNDYMRLCWDERFLGLGVIGLLKRLRFRL